ncbi:MAG: PqqD family peptide modification chaperone [Oscillospiraceae bacterium]|nr:PqqD family peptide modification chaperone [Oscillospiraceae bacterium]
MFYDEAAGKIILLNNSASDFLYLCGDKPLDTIIANYITHYAASGTDAELLKADALRVYAELLEQGVIWEEEDA